jgi:hypothetical protein
MIITVYITLIFVIYSKHSLFIFNFIVHSMYLLLTNFTLINFKIPIWFLFSPEKFMIFSSTFIRWGRRYIEGCFLYERSFGLTPFSIQFSTLWCYDTNF